MSERKTLSTSDAMFEPSGDLDRLRRNAFIAGGIGFVLLAIGFATSYGDPDSLRSFLRAYLIGWLFCLGVAMGLSGINMINHLSGGDWGVSLRRVFEASGRTLPLFILLFVPIALGVDVLYEHWADPDLLNPDSEKYDIVIVKKSALLNTTAFRVLSVAVLALWSVLALILSGKSRRFEETGDEHHLLSCKKWSAGGMVIYILTGTVAAVLWIMSLDPHWFSSLFGVIFVAGQGLSAFAFAVPTLVFLSTRRPFKDHVPPKMLAKLSHDYGKFMLAFVALWAYFMMSQFLIIWSGNLPEEVTWYLDRSSHGWLLISIILVVGHFVLPFLLLLSQDLKKNSRRLIFIACWLLFMRWFDLYWQVAPSLSHDHIAFGWLELVAPLAIGGVWLGFLAGQVKNRTLMPVREPGLQEVLAHG